MLLDSWIAHDDFLWGEVKVPWLTATIQALDTAIGRAGPSRVDRPTLPYGLPGAKNIECQRFLQRGHPNLLRSQG